uniref:Uncharacterized protein n=1 Tax=Arundo donax TaxID=35708 RepID=A0A0A9BL37_ARUDO
MIGVLICNRQSQIVSRSIKEVVSQSKKN